MPTLLTGARPLVLGQRRDPRTRWRCGCADRWLVALDKRFFREGTMRALC